MIKDREAVELLAPAGSYESLTAAAQGGADAIYFGISRLNMRARSSANFGLEDLPRIVRQSKSHGMRSYLTVNTVVFNEEMDQMKEIVDLARTHGVDAVIASDPAVLSYCNESGIPVHLSTQLNISNYDSLRFYARYADVAVLARELSLEQAGEISRAIAREGLRGASGKPFRIEMFVHGALCMAISGKCYLSLHEFNHSANRGDCFQVCRRGYTVTDREREVELDVENEYIMSPRDLKTIHFLNKILDAGVTILKIEGRARPAEYVKTVTACYDEAIRAYVDGTYSREKIISWEERLSSVFNRGFWDGYYLGRRLGEWSEAYGSQATHRKVYVGKGINYFDRVGVAEIAVEADPLQRGDRILVIGPTTGVVEMVISELRVDDKVVPRVEKGETCTFPAKEVVRRSDKVFRLVPREGPATSGE